MTKARTGVVAASFFVLAGAVALFLVLFAARSSGNTGLGLKVSKAGESAESDAGGNAATTFREGPISFEQQRALERTYPAKAISPAIVARAKATFNRLAARDVRQLRAAKRFAWNDGHWKLYGPRVNATEPGVLAFTGATNNTASRVTSLVADPERTGSQRAVPWPTCHLRRISFLTDLTPPTVRATSIALLSAACELTKPLS